MKFVSFSQKAISLSCMNKTKEDFSPETRPWLIELKSLREMLKIRLVLGSIKPKPQALYQTKGFTQVERVLLGLSHSAPLTTQ